MAEDPNIVIRDLVSHADYRACCALQELTWGPGFGEIVPPAILQVAQKMGGVAAGAFDSAGALIGFVFGLTGIRNGVVAHWSDMLAVLPNYRGQHVGQRLKFFQRERARAAGARVMYWTYDPLVARNAYLNIVRLGAFPVEYIENMYGTETGSALHGSIPTDRFVVAWSLGENEATLGRQSSSTCEMCNPIVGGVPAAEPTVRTGAHRVGVQIPKDELTGIGHDQYTAWRVSVRAAVQLLFREDFRVTGFVESRGGSLPYYIFERS